MPCPPEQQDHSAAAGARTKLYGLLAAQVADLREVPESNSIDAGPRQHWGRSSPTARRSCGDSTPDRLLNDADRKTAPRRGGRLGMIARLIEERLGLDPESLGTRALRGSAEGHRHAGREKTPKRGGRAVERLGGAGDVVSSAGRLFDELARRISAMGERKTVRILSLPCSSGEEPYSLAIALLEAVAAGFSLRK